MDSRCKSPSSLNGLAQWVNYTFVSSIFNDLLRKIRGPRCASDEEYMALGIATIGRSCSSTMFLMLGCKCYCCLLQITLKCVFSPWSIYAYFPYFRPGQMYTLRSTLLTKVCRLSTKSGGETTSFLPGTRDVCICV